MTHRDLLCKIKKLEKIEPDEAWINSTRSFVLTYARIQEEREKKSLFRGSRLSLGGKINSIASLFRQRLVFKAASFAVVLIVAGNFVAARAAESLPGESLYPVKLLAEKAELALTLNEDKRIALKFELASRRLNEFSRLVESGKISKGSDPEAVNIAMDGFQNQLSAAVNELDNVAKSGSDNSKAVAVAKMADSKTADYAKKIGSANTNLSAKSKGKITEAINKIEEANISALTVLASATKQSGDAGTVSDSKEIAQKVEEKIKNTEEKAKLIEEKVLAVVVENDLAKARDLAATDPVKALEIISDTNKKIDTTLADNSSKNSAGEPKVSATPESSPLATPSTTPAPSASAEPSVSPAPVPSSSPAPSATPSITPGASLSPSPSATVTPTPAVAITPTPTVTPATTAKPVE